MVRLSPAAGPASGRHSVNVCLLFNTDMKVLRKSEQALQSRGLLLGTGRCVSSTESAKEVLRFLETRQRGHRESVPGGKPTQPNPALALSFLLPSPCAYVKCLLFSSPLAHPNSAKP